MNTPKGHCCLSFHDASPTSSTPRSCLSSPNFIPTQSAARATQQELERWRELESFDVLAVIAEHVKEDATFHPTTSPGTKRVHLTAFGRDYELLLNGSKFFDTRQRKGGGGALDLVMHLLPLNFRSAVDLLRVARL